MKNQTKNPTDLFQGFSNEEAEKILSKARVKNERTERKTNLAKLATNGVSFVQAGEVNPMFTDKPDIYVITLVNPITNKPLEPLYKHKTFFKTLAVLCQGTAIEKAITLQLA